MIYRPSKNILNKYADVLINYALNSGAGVKKGEVVLLQVPECAKPMLASLMRAVTKAQAHFIVQYIPTGLLRDFYKAASEDQLTFFPRKYYKGLIDQVDHSVYIISTTDKKELADIDPKRIMLRTEAFKQYKKWRARKEISGKFTWTLALYGTKEMAKEAGVSLDKYWEQIIRACFLDLPDPISKWRSVVREIERIKKKLNGLEIEKVNIKSKNTDLEIKIGENRRWLGGGGRNIPSFEIFVSPDCRGTEGHIYFNQPLYRHGNLVKGIRLKFEKGKVVEAEAEKGGKFLRDMIKVKGADRVGEFSLTDSRHSRITEFMAETLFDENIGGKYGNTHIALGSAYKDSYAKNPSTVSKAQWKKMGFNESAIHTDIVSTENRIVTAYTKGKRKKVVIYKNGKFTI